MYKCEICTHQCAEREPRKVHVVERLKLDSYGRKRKEIEREIPVCAECAVELEEKPLHIVMAENRLLRQVVSA